MKTAALLRAVLLLIFAMATTGVPTAEAAPMTAEKVLKKTVDRFNSARSITAEYSIDAPSGSDKGKMVLASGRFTLRSHALKTWYNGLTLWTYSPAMGEVNITEPDSDQLMEINPFAIIKSYKSHYTASLLPDSPKGTYRVRFVPKARGASFTDAVVTIDASTFLPKAIVLTLRDSSRVNIAVDRVVTGNAITRSTFEFNPKDAPGAKMVDLR